MVNFFDPWAAVFGWPCADFSSPRYELWVKGLYTTREVNSLLLSRSSCMLCFNFLFFFLDLEDFISLFGVCSWTAIAIASVLTLRCEDSRRNWVHIWLNSHDSTQKLKHLKIIQKQYQIDICRFLTVDFQKQIWPVYNKDHICNNQANSNHIIEPWNIRIWRISNSR